jgi:predicted acylesterase/phospholipase RssA
MSDSQFSLERPRSDHARLGIALSGGGSRAAAFHRGTIRGLEEIGLLDQLDVISSVSGGSVFAAAWMAANWRGKGLCEFLTHIGQELAEGFISRSITLSVVKLLSPSYTRSNLLAETFDRALMSGMQLKDLPERPLLCMNTSVMNTGQVGKFSRFGFSSTGIQAPGQAQENSNPSIPLSNFPVALAATASAAFPIGLPPVYLLRGQHIPDGWGGPRLGHHRRFALTDGGVLENLGLQTLLKSRRFGGWNLVVSDAGRREEPWEPGGFMNSVRGAVMGAVSLPTIQRVMTMMNSKENRHMRLTAYGEIERTWLIEALRGGEPHLGLGEILSFHPTLPRRRILFIRLNQTLNELLATIPRWRLHELAARAHHSLPERVPPTGELLRACEIDLARALEIHSAMGGDERVAELNRISTSFAALSNRDIEGLHAHAHWQVHAMRALYWDRPF